MAACGVLFEPLVADSHLLSFRAGHLTQPIFHFPRYVDAHAEIGRHVLPLGPATELQDEGELDSRFFWGWVPTCSVSNFASPADTLALSASLSRSSLVAGPKRPLLYRPRMRALLVGVPPIRPATVAAAKVCANGLPRHAYPNHIKGCPSMDRSLE